MRTPSRPRIRPAPLPASDPACSEPLHCEAPSPVDPDALICSGSDDEYYDSPAERHRRYETQARRFLEGKPLLILSASLRGPFSEESGWRNPWRSRTTARESGKPRSHRLQRLSSRQDVQTPTPCPPEFGDATGAVPGPDEGGNSIFAELGNSDWKSSKPRRSLSPLSPRPHASSNAYMDDAAWERVHAWRNDVEPVTRDEFWAAGSVEPAAGASPTKRKRGPDPEWLRGAVTKRRLYTPSGQSRTNISQPPGSFGSILPGARSVGAAISSQPTPHLERPPTAQASHRSSQAPEPVSNKPGAQIQPDSQGHQDESFCYRSRPTRPTSSQSVARRATLERSVAPETDPHEPVIPARHAGDGSQYALAGAVPMARKQPVLEDPIGPGSAIDGPTLVASSHSDVEAENENEETYICPGRPPLELPGSQGSKIRYANDNIQQQQVEPTGHVNETDQPPSPTAPRPHVDQPQMLSEHDQAEGHGEVSKTGPLGHPDESSTIPPIPRRKPSFSNDNGHGIDKDQLATIEIPKSRSRSVAKETKQVAATPTVETIRVQVDPMEIDGEQERWIPENPLQPVETHQNQSPWAAKVVDVPHAHTPHKTRQLPWRLQGNERRLTTDSSQAATNKASQSPWTHDLPPSVPIRNGTSRTFQPLSSPTSNENENGDAAKPSPSALPVGTPRRSGLGHGKTTELGGSQPNPPSTPTTKQSSLPTPDLSSPIKQLKEFITPSPQRRRRNPKRVSLRSGHLPSTQVLFDAALSNPWKNAVPSTTKKRVSFAPLPGEGAESSSPQHEPGESVSGSQDEEQNGIGGDGQEYSSGDDASGPKEAGRRSERRRAASPPLQLSQAELPVESRRFEKHFATMTRKGPQVRQRNSKLAQQAIPSLLPSESQQACPSPAFDAMAEAFRAADQATTVAAMAGRRERQDETPTARGADIGDDPEEREEDDAGDDIVTAVLDNLDDYINSFDVDTELRKADKRRAIQS